MNDAWNLSSLFELLEAKENQQTLPVTQWRCKKYQI